MIQHTISAELRTALDLLDDVQLVDNTHSQSIDTRKELREILIDLHKCENAKYEAAQAEITRLRETLQFYADQESWSHINFLNEWIWQGRTLGHASGAIPTREALRDHGKIGTTIIFTGDES
jgi:hypothetical protein